MSVALSIGQTFSLEKSAFQDFEAMALGDLVSPYVLIGETNNNGDSLHDCVFINRNTI